MSARRYIAAIVAEGRVLTEIVELYTPDEREAAKAVAAKTGGMAIDLSRAGDDPRRPAVLLFDVDEKPETIVTAVKAATERQRAAIARLRT